MIPIISVAILAGVMGMAYALLRIEIAKLRREAITLREATVESFKGMRDQQRRVSDFLNQWIPTVEYASQPRPAGHQHIHWMVDHSAGPNWYIYRCRCGKIEEGEL